MPSCRLKWKNEISMPRVLAIFLSLTILASPAMAQDGPAAPGLLRQQDVGAPGLPPDGVFRNFIWGVSMQDVREFESANIMEEGENRLVFIEKPDNVTRLVTYDFIKNRLWRTKYEYVELHSPDTQSVMDVFVGVQTELSRQFGAPVRQETFWQDDRFKYYPQFWNWALVSGHLRFRTLWETANTRVVLQFYRDDAYYRLFYTMEDMRVSGLPKNDSYLKLFPDDSTTQPGP